MARAIVIGAGVGGLCAGARLADSGWDVVVYERLRRVGGRWSSRDVEGFRLPTGAFLIAMDDALARTFTDLGIDFPVRPIEERTVFMVDGELVGTGKRGGLRALLGAAARVDGSDPDSILAEVRSALSGDLPDGEALLPDWLMARGAGSAVVGAVHSLTQSFMGVNSSEVSAASFFEYLRVTAGRGRHGIPPEGSRRLAENLADFIDARGGSVRVGTSVTSIRMEGGRVLGVDVRGGGAVDGDVVVSDIGVEATDRLLPERMPPSADGPVAPSAPGITTFVATRSPLLHHPVVVVSGTRAVCLLTTPTLVAPELAPPGWHFTESISTFRSSLDTAAPSVELERHYADLDDLVPLWRKGRLLHTATYRNDWPVYRAWPGRDRQERFPLPGLALVGDSVKPRGWPGTGASAEGARLVVDELVRGAAADPSG